MLESTLQSEDFCNSLDGYGCFIYNYEEIIANCDPNKEAYQGPPVSPEIDNIIEKSDKEISAKKYAQYIWDEVVLTDIKGEKIMKKPESALNMTTLSQENVTIIPCTARVYMKSILLMKQGSK